MAKVFNFERYASILSFIHIHLHYHLYIFQNWLNLFMYRHLSKTSIFSA